MEARLLPPGGLDALRPPWKYDMHGSEVQLHIAFFAETARSVCQMCGRQTMYEAARYLQSRQGLETIEYSSRQRLQTVCGHVPKTHRVVGRRGVQKGWYVRRVMSSVGC